MYRVVAFSHICDYLSSPFSLSSVPNISPRRLLNINLISVCHHISCIYPLPTTTTDAHGKNRRRHTTRAAARRHFCAAHRTHILHNHPSLQPCGRLLLGRDMAFLCAVLCAVTDICTATPCSALVCFRHETRFSDCGIFPFRLSLGLPPSLLPACNIAGRALFLRALLPWTVTACLAPHHPTP